MALRLRYNKTHYGPSEDRKITQYITIKIPSLYFVVSRFVLVGLNAIVLLFQLFYRGQYLQELFSIFPPLSSL